VPQDSHILAAREIASMASAESPGAAPLKLLFVLQTAA
jgi:hypothetical protein